MPHADSGFRRSGRAFLPQPGAEVSGLHAVPCATPRLEFRSVFLQMRMPVTMRNWFRIARLRRGTPALLVSAAVLLAALLLAGSAAGQDDTSQGIDRGNYNIQQTLEFGGRITDQVGNASI